MTKDTETKAAGRPPKNGRAAMTPAERQRQYRQRLEIRKQQARVVPAVESNGYFSPESEALKGLVARYQVDKTYRTMLKIEGALLKVGDGLRSADSDLQAVRGDLWETIETIRGLRNFLSPGISKGPMLREEFLKAQAEGFPHRLRR